MIVFGLVLLILAVVVIAYVWLATAGMSPVSIDYGILNVELAPLWFFFAGGITLAVATSGIWLMGVGAKASARRAKEMRELRRAAQESDRRAGHERDRAARGSGQGRGSATATPGSGAPAGRTTASTATGADTGRADEQPILPRTGRTDAPGTPGRAGERVDPER